MNEGSIPEQVRRDIENGVAAAAALNDRDLRDAVARATELPVPEGRIDEVYLIMLLLSATLDCSSWPSEWLGNNEFARERDGFVIAAIQAFDSAQGRPERPLNDELRACLAFWEGRPDNENT
jgi:hypothetical protein